MGALSNPVLKIFTKNCNPKLKKVSETAVACEPGHAIGVMGAGASNAYSLYFAIPPLAGLGTFWRMKKYLTEGIPLLNLYPLYSEIKMKQPFKTPK